MNASVFRSIVWAHYKKHGRHDLPWRQTHDIYKVLVSEVMLQQTQVERVIPLYKNFIKQFPTAKRLATAPLSEVLKSWQGLGYNRRAKMLHQAATQLSDVHVLSYRTKHERDTGEGLIEMLEKLPGVGPYTARAVAAFAFNQDVIVIETNIRTAIIHHFFPNKKKISDKEIEKMLISVLPKGRAREWYSALMDYGAHLKRSGVSHNAKSKTYTKQSKFAGSSREARGVILCEFTKGVTSHARLLTLLGPARKEQMKMALKALIKEGLVT